MGIICTHVVSPRARGKIILATGNQNFSAGMRQNLLFFSSPIFNWFPRVVSIKKNMNI